MRKNGPSYNIIISVLHLKYFACIISILLLIYFKGESKCTNNRWSIVNFRVQNKENLLHHSITYFWQLIVIETWFEGRFVKALNPPKRKCRVVKRSLRYITKDESSRPLWITYDLYKNEQYYTISKGSIVHGVTYYCIYCFLTLF